MNKCVFKSGYKRCCGDFGEISSHQLASSQDQTWCSLTTQTRPKLSGDHIPVVYLTPVINKKASIGSDLLIEKDWFSSLIGTTVHVGWLR